MCPDLADILKQRKVLQNKWRKDINNWDAHLDNPSNPAPVKSKTNRPYSKVPDAPRMPKVLLVCKAYKMKETHEVKGSSVTYVMTAHAIGARIVANLSAPQNECSCVLFYALFKFSNQGLFRKIK